MSSKTDAVWLFFDWVSQLSLQAANTQHEAVALGSGLRCFTWHASDTYVSYASFLERSGSLQATANVPKRQPAVFRVDGV